MCVQIQKTKVINVYKGYCTRAQVQYMCVTKSYVVITQKLAADQLKTQLFG